MYTFAYLKQPVGRSRYVLMTDLGGVVVDDGVACRMHEDHFYVTATTSGVDNVYREMLWYNAQWRLKVDVTNVTAALAGVNIAGPQLPPGAGVTLRRRRSLARGLPLHGRARRARCRHPHDLSQGRLRGRAWLRAARAGESGRGALGRAHGGRQGPRHPALRRGGAAPTQAGEGPASSSARTRTASPLRTRRTWPGRSPRRSPSTSASARCGCRRRRGSPASWWASRCQASAWSSRRNATW